MPWTFPRHGELGSAMDIQYGFLGLVVLALDIWAIVSILRSAAEPVVKLVWIVAILLLPVIGLILWLIAGPGSARARL
jgi:hypothetical protein